MTIKSSDNLEVSANIVKNEGENYCDTTSINEDYLADPENSVSPDSFPRTVTTSKGEEMVIALSSRMPGS
jgi:hypothetical protein